MQSYVAQMTDIMNKWMNRVTYRFSWFLFRNLRSHDSDTFLYDKTYGSIISANGWLTSMADYGNGVFNDHRATFS